MSLTDRLAHQNGNREGNSITPLGVDEAKLDAIRLREGIKKI